ncbi:MAG: hypothetical protein ABSG67_22245 [Thermoguttaceae bacterium]|jgi:hypothetical protein
METTDQPSNPKPKLRWYRYCPQIFVVLVIVLIFSLINKLFLADYFVRASEGNASFMPQIYLLLVLLVEASVPVFLLWLSKRHWYQYSLRTLMIVVTVFAVACSWFAVKMQQAKKQRETVEAIEKLNYFVTYDYEMPSYRQFIPKPQPPGPEWLRKLLGIDFFCNVTSIISPENNDINGAVLEHLQGMPQLKQLAINGSNITDAKLKKLKGLTQLQSLDIWSSQITDNGLEHLEGLIQLQRLYIWNSQITDAGLEYLKWLTNLQELDISNSHVTNAGLEHLKVLTKLKTLDLRKTKVTDTGVQDLQKALPNLKIYH